MNNLRAYLPLIAVTSLTLAGTLAAASGGHGDAVQSDVMEPIVSQIVWKFIAFGVLLLVLWKFALPALMGSLNERTSRIEDALEKAEKVNKEAEELRVKHEKMVAESQAEAKRITDEAKEAADKIRSEASESAKKDADEIVARAKNEIRLAQSKAMAEIREQAVELSLAASSAVLGRSLSDDDHRRLASEAISAAASGLADQN